MSTSPHNTAAESECTTKDEGALEERRVAREPESFEHAYALAVGGQPAKGASGGDEKERPRAGRNRSPTKPQAAAAAVAVAAVATEAQPRAVGGSGRGPPDDDGRPRFSRPFFSADDRDRFVRYYWQYRSATLTSSRPASATKAAQGSTFVECPPQSPAGSRRETKDK